RVHAIFFGWLAAFSQHSDHVATNQTNTPNIIPQHLLSKLFFAISVVPPVFPNLFHFNVLVVRFWFYLITPN
ncbi:hypothetical protein, partial [Spirosoma utsteinense]|uniref:hypothetical protein n=1 Tax=Spirosoma utsteinense TaxID=2585773 RepID=UPI001ABC7C47